MMTDHHYRQAPPVHDGVVVVTCDPCGSDVFRGKPKTPGSIARAKKAHELRSRAAEVWEWGSER